MKYIENPNIWYRLQTHFRNNIMPGLENDDEVLALTFRRWLKEQGADIEHLMNQRLVRNGLGIAPHYDRLVFQDDQLATVFILRWS